MVSMENANAAYEFVAESPGFHVCPNCDGDGTTPWSQHHEQDGKCSCCYGSGLIDEKRYQQWYRNYQSQVLYHSGHLP